MTRSRPTQTLQRTVFNDPPWTVCSNVWKWDARNRCVPGYSTRSPQCRAMQSRRFSFSPPKKSSSAASFSPSVPASTSPQQHRYHLWLLLESTRCLVPERIRGGPVGRVGRRKAVQQSSTSSLQSLPCSLPLWADHRANHSPSLRNAAALIYGHPQCARPWGLCLGGSLDARCP